MILLHLLQSLPRPLISFDIQDKIFTNPNETLSKQEDMTKAISIVIEHLEAKERSLFFRFLLLFTKMLANERTNRENR